jgi:hypothetical protein
MVAAPAVTQRRETEQSPLDVVVRASVAKLEPNPPIGEPEKPNDPGMKPTVCPPRQPSDSHP